MSCRQTIRVHCVFRRFHSLVSSILGTDDDGTLGIRVVVVAGDDEGTVGDQMLNCFTSMTLLGLRLQITFGSNMISEFSTVITSVGSEKRTRRK